MATYRCTKCGHVHTDSSAKEWGKVALGLGVGLGLAFAGAPVVAALGGGAILKHALGSNAKRVAKEVGTLKCPKCGGALERK